MTYRSNTRDPMGPGDARETASPHHIHPRVRASLDVARASAAIYVILHHSLNLSPPLGVLFSFGQEAVIVFFLLSGFVIFANENDRVRRPGAFYLRRLRRIYPPMIAAMLISAILWILGLIPEKPTLGSLFGTIFAMQDISFLKPGVVTDPFLGNDPLWSLSYEIFFYLLFPIVMIGWRRSPIATRWLVPAGSVLALATYFVAPNHMSLVMGYYSMWWAGGMAAYLFSHGALKCRSALPEIIGLSSLVLIAMCGVIWCGYRGLGFFPFLIARHCIVVLALFVLLLSPLRHTLANVGYRLARPAASIAGISYGLYIVHYPILVQTGANHSWFFTPAILLTVALAWVADKWAPSLLPIAPRS